VRAATPVDRWTTEPILGQAWSVLNGSPPSAATPVGALRDREIALAMAFWSFFVHDAPVDAALADATARSAESDAFYGRGPVHYARCGFAAPPCVEDIQLYRVAVDGSGERLLGRELSGDTPVWSPDGSRVAYSSARIGTGEGHLYVMDADGTHRVRITRDTAIDRHPSWSPDGTRLVFQRGTTDFGGDLYLVDPETTETTRLTAGDAVDQQPRWSPDGTRIAYASNRGGSYDLWVMDADGSNPRQITYHHADDWWPTWSPDGTQLAFASNRDGDIAIYTVNVDGSNERRLVAQGGTVPAWSPDGRTIAFVDGLTSEVYLVAADGSNARRLTTSRGGNFAPSWSPDGTHLILGGTRRG
jgi:Tol biopolymer transport system component